MAPLWLYPAFLYGAAAVAVPLALHLLQRRQRTVPLPTIRFLAAAARTRFALRRWLILLLRCAVIALLAAAFARPFSDAYLADRRATVVVLDNSFSMRAAGRWAEQREALLRDLESAGRNETIGVMTMNPTPSWLVPLGSEPAAARGAVAGFEPGWDVTRIEPAVRLASDVLAAFPTESRRILLVTDHQRTGWIGTAFDRPLAPGVELRAGAVASTPRNQAYLAQSRVVRHADGRLAVECFVGGGNAGPRRMRAFAEASGTALAETRIELAAGERRQVTLPLEGSDAGRWVRVELDADDLPADDVTYALTPPPVSATPPLIVDGSAAGAGYDYVMPALLAASKVAPFAQPQPIPSGDWPSRGAAVLRSTAMLDGAGTERLDRFLLGGGVALIFVDAKVAGTAWWQRHSVTLNPIAANATPATVREWVLPHPFVAGIGAAGLRDLVGWRFQRGWSLPAALDPIAYWSDGSIAVGELRVGRGRALVCGFSADRRDGDWPISIAFVPFLHRGVRYLLEAQAELPPERSLRVSEPVALPAGSGVWRCLGGPTVETAPREVSGSVTAAVPGVYAFDQGSETALWAVNVASEESDVTPWTDGEPWLRLKNPAAADPRAVATERVRLAAADAEQKTGWWAWCLTAAALLALIELTFANRTAR